MIGWYPAFAATCFVLGIMWWLAREIDREEEHDGR